MSKDNIYTGYLNGGYRISVMLCLPMGHGQTCPFHQESQLQIRSESHYASDTLTDRFKIRNEFAVGRVKLSVYKSLPVALMSKINLVIR